MFKLRRKKKSIQVEINPEKMSNAVADGIALAEINKRNAEEVSSKETNKLLLEARVKALPNWKKRKLQRYLKMRKENNGK